METSVQFNIQKAKQWLVNDVFPIWFEKGFDHNTNCFVEAISTKTEPILQMDRRALVQARQIYSLTEAVKLGLFEKENAKTLIQKNVELLISKYRFPTGAFAHSVNSSLKMSNHDIDLYTQAFVLFGLAKAYEILRKEDLKIAAIELLNFLKRERHLERSGYSEIKGTKILFQSNPHMHLFEAALAWMSIDSQTCWRSLADELKNLCLNSFIDKKDNLLIEHYSEPWISQKENNEFIFEPGHHYEWAWLLLQYQQLTAVSTHESSLSLFLAAEKHGLSKDKKFVVDEVLSNFEIKKTSSRFWPQCERIKAACALGVLQANPADQVSFAEAADQSFETLFKYLNIPNKGLWIDTYLEDESFENQPAKASSLYHIINAISEYSLKRPRFNI